MNQDVVVMKSFKHQLKDWSILVEIDAFTKASIEFIVTSKKQKQLQYKGSINQTNLSEQLKDYPLESIYEFFLFLQKENSKYIRIYEFLPDLETLRFAYRKAKKVINLILEKYVNGQKQQIGHLVPSESRLSITANKLNRMVSIAKSVLQVKIQRQSVCQKIYYPQSEQKLSHESDEDIDYEDWLNSGQESDQINELVESFKIQELEQIVEKPNVRQVESHIVEKSEVKQQLTCQKTIMKEVILENVQLREQRDQLLERVALLEQENKKLKSKLQIFETESKDKALFEKNISDLGMPDFQLYRSQTKNIPDSHSPFRPTETTPNELTLTKTSSQRITYTPSMKDQWAQQFQNTKKNASQSDFFMYFNTTEGKFDISYKMLLLKEFEVNFFPFWWRDVKVLTVDGNFLGSQGFNRIVEMQLPQLTQISAGYNGIRNVKSLENHKNLTKVDLRANPLSQETKFYVKKIREAQQLQILLT